MDWTDVFFPIKGISKAIDRGGQPVKKPTVNGRSILNQGAGPSTPSRKDMQAYNPNPRSWSDAIKGFPGEFIAFPNYWGQQQGLMDKLVDYSAKHYKPKNPVGNPLAALLNMNQNNVFGGQNPLVDMLQQDIRDPQKWMERFAPQREEMTKYFEQELLPMAMRNAGLGTGNQISGALQGVSNKAAQDFGKSLYNQQHQYIQSGMGQQGNLLSNLMGTQANLSGNIMQGGLGLNKLAEMQRMNTLGMGTRPMVGNNFMGGSAGAIPSLMGGLSNALGMLPFLF